MLKSDFELSHLDNRLSNLCISSCVHDLLSEFCDIDWIIGTDNVHIQLTATAYDSCYFDIPPFHKQTCIPNGTVIIIT